MVDERPALFVLACAFSAAFCAAEMEFMALARAAAGDESPSEPLTISSTSEAKLVSSTSEAVACWSLLNVLAGCCCPSCVGPPKCELGFKLPSCDD